MIIPSHFVSFADLKPQGSAASQLATWIVDIQVALQSLYTSLFQSQETSHPSVLSPHMANISSSRASVVQLWTSRLVLYGHHIGQSGQYDRGL